MRRYIALFLLVLGLAPGILRRPVPEWNRGPLDLRIIALKVPQPAEYARSLGPFKLERAWQLTSPVSRFGGFSTLLPVHDGQLTAISDKAWELHFTLPGRIGRKPRFGPVYKTWDMRFEFGDIEAAAVDPISGTIWLSSEGHAAIARFGPGMRFEGLVQPKALQAWNGNSAAEAMTRLPDGRFVLLREAFAGLFENRDHAALIFDGDPVAGARARHFEMSGPANFAPTEMAQLPDGRILVLMRRLVWPFPVRFAGRIAIGNPARIKVGKVWHLREVARLTSTRLADNFEGMSVEQRADGKLNVWLISDDNASKFQRTLLWKLSVDPADLPG